MAQSAKRAGNIYANAMKNPHGGYPDPNVAMLFVEGGQYVPYNLGTKNKKLNFQTGGKNKYAQNIYGDEMKKQLKLENLKNLASSNGFNTGYTSDPYHSTMSSGLPAALNTTKQTKSKAYKY